MSIPIFLIKVIILTPSKIVLQHSIALVAKMELITDLKNI